jgi:hypothetical protein
MHGTIKMRSETGAEIYTGIESVLRKYLLAQGYVFLGTRNRVLWNTVSICEAAHEKNA